MEGAGMECREKVNSTEVLWAKLLCTRSILIRRRSVSKGREVKRHMLEILSKRPSP